MSGLSQNNSAISPQIAPPTRPRSASLPTVLPSTNEAATRDKLYDIIKMLEKTENIRINIKKLIREVKNELDYHITGILPNSIVLKNLLRKKPEVFSRHAKLTQIHTDLTQTLNNLTTVDDKREFIKLNKLRHHNAFKSIYDKLDDNTKEKLDKYLQDAAEVRGGRRKRSTRRKRSKRAKRTRRH